MLLCSCGYGYDYGSNRASTNKSESRPGSKENIDQHKELRSSTKQDNIQPDKQRQYIMLNELPKQTGSVPKNLEWAVQKVQSTFKKEKLNSPSKVERGYKDIYQSLLEKESQKDNGKTANLNAVRIGKKRENERSLQVALCQDVFIVYVLDNSFEMSGSCKKAETARAFLLNDELKPLEHCDDLSDLVVLKSRKGHIVYQFSSKDLSRMSEKHIQELVLSDKKKEILLELKKTNSIKKGLAPKDEKKLEKCTYWMKKPRIYDEGGLNHINKIYEHVSKEKQAYFSLPIHQIMGHDSKGFSKDYILVKKAMDAFDFFQLVYDTTFRQEWDSLNSTQKKERKQSVFKNLVVFFLEMSRALQAYQQTGLVYIDVKLEQMLINSTGQAILGDLDSGREPCKQDNSIQYTPLTAAPEVKNAMTPHLKSDVYSLAKEVEETLTYLRQFLLKSEQELLKKKLTLISKRFSAEEPDARGSFQALDDSLFGLLSVVGFEFDGNKDALFKSVFEERRAILKK